MRLVYQTVRGVHGPNGVWNLKPKWHSDTPWDDNMIEVNWCIPIREDRCYDLDVKGPR